MKNFKKVLSLVLAFAMVLSSMTISFAAEAMTQTEADALYDLGLFKGTSATDKVLNLEGELTREQAIKLMGDVFGWDIDMDAVSEFEDVANWAQPYAAAAVEKGVTKGVGNGKFGGTNKVSGKVLLTLFVRELGYTAEPSEATQIAIDAKIIALQDALALPEEALRADLTKVAYNTLLATPVGEDATIIEKLVEAGKVDEAKATELGLIEEEVLADLTVESATADNLKEIVVVYNKAVDKDSAEKADNYKLDGSKKVGKAELQEDGKTVVLTINYNKDAAGNKTTENSLKNQENYKLTVSGVKDADKVAIKKQVVEFRTFDGEMPRVTGIEFTGPKAFTVKFDEPINPNKVTSSDAPVIVVKSGNSKVSVKSTQKADFDGKELKVNLSSSLKDSVDYTFTITNVKDYAEYANFAYEEVITYADVKDLPVATLVDADQKVVKVEFSNPVKGLTKYHFYHTFSAWKAIDVFKNDDDYAKSANKINSKDYYKTVYVQFATTGKDTEHPLQEGDVEVHVLGKATPSTPSNASAIEVKDAWGNKLEEQTLIATIESDRIAPTVVSAEVTGKNEVTIVFDEKMDTAELTKTANYKFYDEDEKVVTSGVKGLESKDSGKKVVISTKDFQGKTRTLEIKDLVDASIYKNKLEKQTFELIFTDKEIKGINRVEYKASEDTLYVVYNEEMNDTAIDIKQYQLQITDNKNTPADASDDVVTLIKLESEISFFNDNKVVKLELKEDEEAKKLEATFTDSKLTAKLIIGRVEDLAGNTIDGFANTPHAISTTFVAPKIKGDKINLIAKNKVTIQLDQELVEISEDDFRVTTDGVTTAVKPAGVDYENNDDGALITLTLTDDAAPDAANLVVTAIGNATGTKNSFGEPIEGFTRSNKDTDDTNNINDKVLPVVKKNSDDKAMVTATTVDKVKVTFVEAMKPSSVSYTDITIDGRDVETISFESGDTVLVINLKHKDDATVEELKAKAVEIAKIADAAGNLTEETIIVDILD